jgi:hypothetical protein
MVYSADTIREVLDSFFSLAPSIVHPRCTKLALHAEGGVCAGAGASCNSSPDALDTEECAQLTDAEAAQVEKAFGREISASSSTPPCSTVGQTGFSNKMGGWPTGSLYGVEFLDKSATDNEQLSLFRQILARWAVGA